MTCSRKHFSNICMGDAIPTNSPPLVEDDAHPVTKGRGHSNCQRQSSFTKTKTCRYVRTYVRMYICMYLCMYVCMYVSMHVCMYPCMYVYIYVCVCICMYGCVPACVN